MNQYKRRDHPSANDSESSAMSVDAEGQTASVTSRGLENQSRGGNGPIITIGFEGRGGSSNRPQTFHRPNVSQAATNPWLEAGTRQRLGQGRLNSSKMQDGYQALPSSHSVPPRPRSPLSCLCVVCNKKPIHPPYATCSLKCAAELKGPESRREERKKPRICPVCQMRPCAIGSNGTQYPTCGYTCSSKLPSPRQTRMCQFCGSKPQGFNAATGGTYPHCSRACRDNETANTYAASTKGKCSTCIVCWRRGSSNSTPLFCSQSCLDALQHCAPTMVEIPDGHVYFYTISDLFKEQWDANLGNPPIIRHIYMLVPGEVVHKRHNHLKDILPPTPSKESQGWIPISSECSTGMSSITEPCPSPSCTLCGTICNGIVVDSSHHRATVMFSTPSAADAFTNSKNCARNRPRGAKTMILADVISSATQEVELTQAEHSASRASDPAYEPVRTIGGDTKRRLSKDTGELHVYMQDAVLAKYLVVYHES